MKQALAAWIWRHPKLGYIPETVAASRSMCTRIAYTTARVQTKPIQRPMEPDWHTVEGAPVRKKLVDIK